jgi:hypothetical protein
VGQIRAEKLSPEERAASARKAARARWHDASAVLTIRDTIRGLENGTVDSDKARWVEGFAKNLKQRAELIHQADQLGIDPIGQFVENYFFPRLEHEIRECTLAGYRGRWRAQLKPRCENETVRAFNVLSAQGVLDSIHRQNPEMTRSTLVHLRNLLSLVFDDAERLGLMDKSQGNPVRLVRIPKRAPKGKDTYAYSLRELETILAVLPEPAATVCAVAG